MADYKISVLQKAAKILSMLGRAYRPATLTEIAKTTEIPRNTVFRILKTFEEDGFVQQANERWSLGPDLWELVQRDIENRLKRWERAMEWENFRRNTSGGSTEDGKTCHTQAETTRATGATVSRNGAR